MTRSTCDLQIPNSSRGANCQIFTRFSVFFEVFFLGFFSFLRFFSGIFSFVRFFLNHADKLQFFEPSLKLTGNTIADLEVHNDQLIAGTREQIFYLDKKNDEFNLMPGKLNDVIEKSELNKILSLDHENLIIGTLKNGFLKWNRNNEGMIIGFPFWF